jgi:bifunctional N-acetylglucosamine-1-phosphate-uridyltransferase/glucosamine-1-phosphate-acetyltransferase GlmU-like protein
MLIRTIEVNGEKRIISSKKIVFPMPNGETLVVKKGEIGAVCDGRTQISDDAWASKDVYLKDAIILGKVIVLGDTSIDHCCIEYFGEENSSQNSGILIEGKNTLENTFIKGNKIKIKNSRVKSSNILNHAEIFDSDVCHSYVSDFSKICNGAKVE